MAEGDVDAFNFQPALDILRKRVVNLPAFMKNTRH